MVSGDIWLRSLQNYCASEQTTGSDVGLLGEDCIKPAISYHPLCVPKEKALFQIMSTLNGIPNVPSSPVPMSFH